MRPGITVLILALGLGFPALWHGPVAVQAAAAEKASPQEAPTAKMEKLVASVRDRLNDYQQEELQIEAHSLRAQQAAMQGLKEPAKVADLIAKGQLTSDLRAYRNTILACAREWSGFQQRFAGLERSIKGLTADRPGAPADLQGEIDALVTRFEQKSRGLQMKVGELYERVAEYRSALAIYMAFYKEIPEDKRAAERTLQEKIADVSEKCGDNATALNIVKGLFEARPEKDRFKDTKLGERLGRLYEKIGDLRTALTVYKGTYEGIPAASRAKQGAAIAKKIAELEKKASGQKK